MVMRYARLMLGLIAISGCDPLYGPNLLNALNTHAEISITYADGVNKQVAWPPCADTAFGKGESSGDAIREIVVHQDGMAIYRLNAEQVRHMLEKEHTHDGYSVWSVASDGIQFETSADPRGCAKGK